MEQLRKHSTVTVDTFRDVDIFERLQWSSKVTTRKYVRSRRTVVTRTMLLLLVRNSMIVDGAGDKRLITVLRFL